MAVGLFCGAVIILFGGLLLSLILLAVLLKIVQSWFHVRINGLRWRKIRMLALSSPSYDIFGRVGTELLLQAFPRGCHIVEGEDGQDEVADDARKMLRTLIENVEWLVMIQRLHYKFDWNLLRFHISISGIDAFISPRLTSRTKKGTKQKVGLEELIKRQFGIGIFIYQLASRFLCLEVTGVNILFTHTVNLKESHVNRNECDHRIFLAGFSIANLCIFTEGSDAPDASDNDSDNELEADDANAFLNAASRPRLSSLGAFRRSSFSDRLRQVPALQIDQILAFERIIDGQSYRHVQQPRRVLKTEALALTISNYRKTFLIDIEISTQIEIDLWISFILIFVSLGILSQNGESQIVESSQQQSFKLSFLPINMVISLHLVGIRLSAHLPYHDKDQLRFEEARIVLEELRAHAYIVPSAYELPLICASVDSVSLGSVNTGSLERGVHSFSNVDAFFDRGMSAFLGEEVKLILVKSLRLVNYYNPHNYQPNHQVDIEKMAQWIEQMSRTGNIPWSFSNETKPQISSFSLSTPDPSILKIDCRNCPFPDPTLKLLKNQVILDAEAVSFLVPFEYPLAVFFDHINYFVKAAVKPHKKAVEPQDFDIFCLDWRISLQCRKIQFGLLADPFERKIQNILKAKMRAIRRMTRVEDLFWKRAQNAAFSSNNSCSDALVHACKHPDILKSKPWLPYQRLCSQLFEIYRGFFGNKSQDEEVPMLFNVTAEDLCGDLLWSQSFLLSNDQVEKSSSMAEILNAIEGGDHYTSKLMPLLDIFLGCAIDATACNVNVQLNDFIIPLTFAPALKIYGLLFFAEDLAYPESIVMMPITVYDGLVRQLVVNLYGLDQNGIVNVPRCILPLRIFHCMHISAFDPMSKNKPLRVGFSPSWDGSFLMLDRCFDMFSKPSEEQSPYLAIWDKLRMIFCGSFSRVSCLLPCQIICTTGPDLWSLENFMQLDFSSGFEVGLDKDAIVFAFDEAFVTITGRELRILHEQLSTSSRPYFIWDLSASSHHKNENAHHSIPLVHFPKTLARFSFRMSNSEGLSLLPHYDVKLVAGRHDDKSAISNVDSYALFRIKNLSINVSLNIDPIETVAKVITPKNLWISYYREIEAFIKHYFVTMVPSAVRRGPLFSNPFVAINKKVNISTILSEIHAAFCSSGPFSIRILHFYGIDRYGGAQLVCDGSQVWLDWRKGKRLLSDRDGKRYKYFWSFYFGEVSFATVRIAVVSCKKIGEHEEQIRMLPGFENIEGILMYEILSAPRLFYLAIDELCFKDDEESLEIQKNSILSRLLGITGKIDELLVQLKSCDPLEDMNRFQTVRQDLSVLIEQNEYLEGYMKDDDESLHKNRASIHHFIMHYAQLVWHKRLRDALFDFIDNQIHYQRIVKGITNAAVRLINSIALSPAQSDSNTPKERTKRPVKERGKPHGSRSSIGGTGEAARKFYESLILQPSETFVAQEEYDDLDTNEAGTSVASVLDFSDTSSVSSRSSISSDTDVSSLAGVNLFEKPKSSKKAQKLKEREAAFFEWCGPTELTKYGMEIPQLIEVHFVEPQISLLGRCLDGGEAALIVMAKHAVMEYSPVYNGAEKSFDDQEVAFEEEHRKKSLVGRRTKIVLDQAQLFVTYRRNFGKESNTAWPPFFPTKYLLTQQTESRLYIKISEKVHATFIYDVGNPLFSPPIDEAEEEGQEAKLEDCRYKLFSHFSQGDSIQVRVPTLSILTTSEQYSVFHDIIVNLLVYRDPNQVIRADQLNSLVLASNVYDKNEILGLVQRLQRRTSCRFRELLQKLSKRQAFNNLQKLALPKNGFSVIGSFDEALTDTWWQKYEQLVEWYDELGIIVEAMRIVKTHADRLKQRQSRLSLNVEIGHVQWSLLLEQQSAGAVKLTVPKSKSTSNLATSPLADWTLKRISETWVSAADGSSTNVTEIASLIVLNRLPESFYRTLIAPIEAGDILQNLVAAGVNISGLTGSGISSSGGRGVTKATTLRFFWRSLDPVGGIMIIEHIEVNLKTLHVQLTYQIAEELFRFFFPVVIAAKDASNASRTDTSSDMTNSGASILKTTAELSRSESIDELREMKERASTNCSFVYIKIPAMQHVISYKVILLIHFRLILFLGAW